MCVCVCVCRVQSEQKRPLHNTCDWSLKQTHAASTLTLILWKSTHQNKTKQSYKCIEHKQPSLNGINWKFVQKPTISFHIQHQTKRLKWSSKRIQNLYNIIHIYLCISSDNIKCSTPFQMVCKCVYKKKKKKRKNITILTFIDFKESLGANEMITSHPETVTIPLLVELINIYCYLSVVITMWLGYFWCFLFCFIFSFGGVVVTFVSRWNDL